MRRFGFLFVILYFTFIGGAFYTEFNFPLRVLNQILVTLLLGGWLARLIVRREAWPRTPLDIPLLVWLGANVVSAGLGLSPRYSLEKIWTALILSLGFYWLVNLRRRGFASHLTQAVYLSAAAICLTGIVEFAAWYFGLPLVPTFVQGWPQATGWTNFLPPYVYRIGLPLNGATPLSNYLAVLIPPGLALAFTASRRDDQHALWIWLGLAFFTEFLSFSRGGLLALGVALPLLALAALNERRDWLTRLVAFARRRWWIFVLAFVAILLLAGVWFNNAFVGRQGSNDFRVHLWRNAMQIFSEHPLAGVGPGNFARALLRYNDPTLFRQQLTTAHNIYLNTAAELGLLGLAAGVGLLAALVRVGWQRWRTAPTRAERWRVAGCGAALAGFATQGLVDTFISVPSLLPIIGLMAYLLVDEPPISNHKRQAWKPGLALAGLSLFAMWWTWVDVADFYFETSLARAKQNRLPEAIQAAEQAQALDPTWPLYIFQAAYLKGQSDDPTQLADALQTYERGLSLEPVIGQHTTNYAAALWRSGLQAQAIAQLETVVRAAPAPLDWLNLGYFYEQTGAWDNAISAYAQSLAAQPDLAGSLFWQATEWRVNQWRAIELAAEQHVSPLTPLTSWRLSVALAREDWPAIDTAATARLAEAPTDCVALAAHAQIALRAKQWESALQSTTQAIDANPNCDVAYRTRGLARQGLGQLNQAERDWRMALFVHDPLAGFALGELARAEGQLLEAAQAYGLAIFPYAVSEDVMVALYGRRVLFDRLPPLLHIGLGPTQAAPWLALAELHLAQGDAKSARRIYTILLMQDPFLPEARERLNTLP